MQKGQRLVPSDAEVRPARIQFGNSCFDPAAMRLTVDGEQVALEPRPLALLGLLLSRRGEAVAKSQIFDALWSDRVVTESSLTKCVARLRLALGDHDHTIVRTVHGFGYRLDIPAGLNEPEPASLPDPQAEPAPPRTHLLSRSLFLPRPGKYSRTALVAAGLVLCLMAAFSLKSGRHALAAPPLQARTLYMKGLQDWAQRTPASLTQAVQEFTAALRIDPEYAEAHVGLANCYNLLPEYAAMPSAQAFPLAKEQAARAISLNPDLAAAHAAHAFALFWGDWNFPEALHEYEIALRLAPDNPTIHHWFANSLDAATNHARALVQIDRALELDPSSHAIRADRGLILFDSGRVAEALTLLRTLVASTPDFLSPHAYLADIALAEGNDAEYLNEWGTQVRLQHNRAEEAIVRAAQAGLKAGGQKEMRRALLDARLAAFADGTIPAVEVARSYAMMGDGQQALTYLSLAIDRHDPTAIFVFNSSEFRPFLQDAQMAPLLDRLRTKLPKGFDLPE